MVFAPKLQSGVAFEQPVSQPNAMSAVANLFNFGMSTLQASAGSTDNLTEDEKFAVAVREFEGEKGAAFTWDRKGMREFIFKYPQFTSQAQGFGENIGVMMKNPTEVARDAVTTWISDTPEGVMAATIASGMEEEEGLAYISEQFTMVKQQEAEIAKLNRNSAQYEAEGTLTTKQWDVLKPGQKDFVDNTVQTILGPIISDVMNGVTVDIPPELQSQMGLRYDKVDMANLPAVLSDIKINLERQARSTYATNFGVDALPPEAWSKEVFTSIDSLIEIGKSIDTPQERASAMQALVQEETLKQLDAAGVAVALEVLKGLPPDVANALISDQFLLSDRVKGVLAPKEGGSIFSSAEIAQKIADGSVADAKGTAEDMVKIIDKGFMPEFFTAFKESAKKSGYKVVDSASFKTIVGKNLAEIKRLTSESPDFRAEFSDWVTSDIQQTISVLKSNLPAGLTIINNKGKFVVVAGEDFDWAGFNAMNLVRTKGGQAPISIQQYIQDHMPSVAGASSYVSGGPKSTPKFDTVEGLSLDTLNEKVATLNLLGDVGKEVQDALGILNTSKESNSQPASRTGPRARGRDSGKGTVTKSTKDTTDIGSALGIDFLAYETEAGLPEGYLNKVAMIESGGDPNAQNSNSSAGGLFQQIDSNAAAYGVTDKFDPVQSTEGAVRFAVENKNYLTSVLGREPTGGELYLAHQQGPGGAARLLANPDAKAVDIVGLDAVKLNGGDANMSAGEFANIWISKYNGSRGQTSVSQGTSAPVIDLSGRSGDPESLRGAVAPPTGSLKGNIITFDSPEIQQLVEMSNTSPEETVKVAKELLTRPIDPSVKALIEALVRIGNK